MKKWIHRRLGTGPGRNHFDAMQDIPTILKTFNQEFGSGYADPDSLIDAIKEEIYFDSRKSPQVVFDWLADNLKAVNSALSSPAEPNAELADDDYRLIILKGLENVSKKTQFWTKIDGELKQQKREKKTQTASQIQLMIINHWNDHSPPDIVLDQTVRTRLKPLGHGFAGGANGKENDCENDHCANCANEKNNRLQLQDTHSTANCWYGNKPGYERINKFNKNRPQNRYRNNS